MAWRGRETPLELRSIDEFKAYMHGLNYNNWRPSGIVQHNTASPTLEQWWHSVPPEQRMENLISYYRDEMGWSAGPHVFVDGVSFWVLTDLNVSGVHSPSWNATRLGIEMVGDYHTESDETGMGAKVYEMTTALFGECCAFFGWDVNNDKIKQHKEDPNSDHDCPGANVVKSEFLDDVTQYMGDGGDHLDPRPERVAGEVYGLTAGDTLNIRASPSTSAPIIGTADNGDRVMVVDETYNGSTRWFRCQFGAAAGAGVAVYGWASGSYIRRIASPGAPTPPENDWHEDITATVFGMPGDEQESAYGGWIDEDSVGVAFPYKWRDEPPPAIIVEGPRGQIETEPLDVGPWNIDDPRYVLHGRRPLAEKQYRFGLEAQNGMIPSNDAGIDLTVPVAEAVGVLGKGKVRWRFK